MDQKMAAVAMAIGGTIILKIIQEHIVGFIKQGFTGYWLLASNLN